MLRFGIARLRRIRSLTMLVIVLVIGMSVIMSMDDSINVLMTMPMLDLPRTFREMPGLLTLALGGFKPRHYFLEHANLPEE
jgi:hypothetical protein